MVVWGFVPLWSMTPRSACHQQSSIYLPHDDVYSSASTILEELVFKWGMLIIPLASWCNALASFSIDLPSRLPISSLQQPRRGVSEKPCSVSVTATTTILQDNWRKLLSSQWPRKDLPQLWFPSPPSQRFLSWTSSLELFAADTITTATTAAITGEILRVLKRLLTGGVPQAPKKQKSTDPVEPTPPASEDPDSFGTAKAQIFV